MVSVGVLTFEWDDEKASSNLLKHGVSFFEALTVFGDPMGIYKRDPRHALDEDRILLIGFSKAQRIITVVHVERGVRLRLISARSATPRERRDYGKASLGR
jgi:uncharacterized DUF497 family protein